MRFQDALEIMAFGFKPNKGFMVHFEHKNGCVFRSDYFPDKHAGEALIPSEELAWTLAQNFAERTAGKCVNIYIVDDTFNPVPGYEAKRKNPYE